MHGYYQHLEKFDLYELTFGYKIKPQLWGDQDQEADLQRGTKVKEAIREDRDLETEREGIEGKGLKRDLLSQGKFNNLKKTFF